MKLSKAQIVEQGKKLAQENAQVNAMTVSEIEALEHRDRLIFVNELAKQAIEQNSVEPNWALEISKAFSEEVLRIWFAKIKHLENARKDFKSACSGMSIEDASTKTKELLESMKIRGARIDGDCGRVSVTVERAWTIGGSLYVAFDRDDTRDQIINPDNTNQRAGYYHVSTKLSWSSTGRSVSDSVACIKLYQELTEAAAEVEAVMGREHISFTHGM